MATSLWDRLATRVKRARRSEERSDTHGSRASARLAELLPLAAAVEAEIDREIVRVRDQGGTWTALGAILGLTKQGAQHRYRIAMTRTGRAIYHGSFARTMADLEVKHAGPSNVPKPDPEPPNPRRGATDWSQRVQAVSASCPMEDLANEEVEELLGAAEFLRNYCQGELLARKH